MYHKEPFELTTVVGIAPLPGTARYQGESISSIVDAAVEEAVQYAEAGIDSIILQNINDWPAREHVDIETVAYLSAIGSAVRRAVGSSCRLGISVLRNDGEAAVAVAHAVGAQFIRAKIYVGAMLSANGIEMGCMNGVLSLRQKIGSDVEIWADIRSRTAVPLVDYPILQECGFAAEKGMCRSFLLSGGDMAQVLETAQCVKQAFPNHRVILGGGVNLNNLEQVMANADGAIVASCLKQDGRMHAPIDPVRLEHFMRCYRAAIGHR